MKYFKNIQTMEELKDKFRELVQEYHPDKNGNEKGKFREIMKIINAEYEQLFKEIKNDSTKKSSKYWNVNDGFREIIQEIITFPDITIEIVGQWIWVSGNTYPKKDKFKDLGFYWSGKHKKWFFAGKDFKKKKIKTKKSYDDIKQKYGCHKVDNINKNNKLNGKKEKEKEPDKTLF